MAFKPVSQETAVQNEGGSNSGELRFKKGIDYGYLSTKKTYEVRILPALDQSYRKAPEFMNTVLPYRSETRDEKTRNQLFNPWAIRIRFYDFYGPSDIAFVSPTMADASQYPGAGLDPIYDIRNHIRGDDDLKVRFKHLIEREGKTSSIPLPYFRTGWVINALYRERDGREEKPWRAGLLVVSSLCFGNLCDLLNQKRGAGEDMIGDEKYGAYMLNDVTHPKTGLVAIAYKTDLMSGGATLSTMAFHFTEPSNMLEGYVPLDLDTVTVRRQSKDIHPLHARYNLMDPDSLFQEYSYKQVLDWVAEDGRVPYDLMVAACGDYVGYDNVPKPASTPSVQGASNLKTADVSTSAKILVDNPSRELFYIQDDGATTKQATAAEFISVMESKGVNTQEKLEAFGQLACWLDEASSGWKKASEIGFKVSTPAAPAVPPVTTPAVPAMPHPNTKAVAPADPQPDTSSSLTEDEEAEFAQLQKKLESSDNGVDSLTAQEMDRFTELSERR
jgi:hypothetical protein